MPIFSGLSVVIPNQKRRALRLTCASESRTSGSLGNRAQTRAGKLQFDVVAGLRLRGVHFHRGGPGGDDFRRGNVDQHGHGAGRFGFGRYRVEQQLVDGVGRQRAQFLKAAVPSQPRRVPHQMSEPGVVRVLVFLQTGRQYDTRTHPPQNARQFDGVSDADLKAGVPVEYQEFHGRAEESGGLFCFGDSLGGRAMRARFAARTDDKMGDAASAGFTRHHAAASELDIIGMRAKGQQWRMLRRGFRCTLHRDGQLYHASRK